jgi:hypothetical protein
MMIEKQPTVEFLRAQAFLDLSDVHLLPVYSSAITGAGVARLTRTNASTEANSAG